MPYLLDTNVLVRLANSSDAQHAEAVRAVLKLHRRGESLRVTSQVLIEFRGVATRPLASNGLGLSTADAENQAAGFEIAFPLLPENADIFPRWKSLVGSVGIVGKQVHDARLAAVCMVHNIPHLLTFNVAHFARITGLTAIHPASV